MLAVVNTSPLAAITSQAFAKSSASGNADLALRLNLPVLNIDQSKVQGTVSLPGNDVQIVPAIPAFTRSRGVVSFNESGVGVVNVQARFLGGDVRVEGNGRPSSANAQANGAEPLLSLRAAGSVSADGLRQAKELGSLARLANAATGATNYNAVFTLRRGVPEIVVTSNLQGLGLALPVPLAKAAEASLPLRFENTLLRESQAPGQKLQDVLHLEVGKIIDVSYVRDLSTPEPRVVRGAIAVGLSGGETAPLPDEGVVANVNFAQLDVDAWERLLSEASGVSIAQASSGRARANDPALAYLPTVIAVRANELIVDGHKFNAVVVGGSRDGPDLARQYGCTRAEWLFGIPPTRCWPGSCRAALCSAGAYGHRCCYAVRH